MGLDYYSFGVIEVQSSLPSSHIFFDEVDNHRAEICRHLNCNPRVWNTVKSFFYYLPRRSILFLCLTFLPYHLLINTWSLHLHLPFLHLFWTFCWWKLVFGKECFGSCCNNGSEDLEHRWETSNRLAVFWVWCLFRFKYMRPSESHSGFPSGFIRCWQLIHINLFLS